MSLIFKVKLDKYIAGQPIVDNTGVVEQFNDVVKKYVTPIVSVLQVPAATADAMDGVRKETEALVNSQRDADEAEEDAALVEAFNGKLGDFSRPASDVLDIPAVTEGAIGGAYSAGQGVGKEIGRAEAEQEAQRDKQALLDQMNDAFGMWGQQNWESLEDISRELSGAFANVSMNGYSGGEQAERERRDDMDKARLAEINAQLEEKNISEARSLDDVDDKIPDVYTEGHKAGQVIGYNGGLVNGYNSGVQEERTRRDTVDARRLSEINAAITDNGVAPADTLDDVDEKVAEVFNEGYSTGANDANSERDAKEAQELSEINEVIDRWGGTKSETLDGVSESVDTTIGAANMKAHTEGYTQGVSDTNATRDAEEAAEDAALVASFNAGLGGYGTHVDSVEKIPNATYDAIGQAYSKGESDGREQEGFARDTLDASRLVEINAALTANGGTAADTLDGVDEKIPAVHAAGVQSEYDRFWGIVQGKGQRTNYSYAFGGDTFPKDAFKPKYNIRPKRAQSMFYEYGSYAGTAPYRYDLTQQLEECGVVLDISQCTVFTTMFHYSLFTRLPVMDFKGSGGASLGYTFSYMGQLETIDKIVSYENTNYQSTTFQNDSKLTNIVFEGVIAYSINLQWSTKLSRASIESIIAALSTTASGKSITLSKTAVNNAFETSAGAADGASSDLWLTMMREEGHNNPDAVYIKPSGWAVNLA